MANGKWRSDDRLPMPSRPMSGVLNRRGAMEPEFLEYGVAAGFHAQGLVGLLGAEVAILDVEPQADDVGAAGLVVDVPVESPEDALAAEVGLNIDALQPPDPAVAPVAPLAGDGRLADQPGVLAAMDLGDPVAEAIGIGQRPGDAAGRESPGRAPCARSRGPAGG